MTGEAAGIRFDDKPEDGRAKLAALTGDQEVTDRLAAAIGLSRAAFPLHEIYWAARKFLESLAADGPLVALIDDIHWAESAFLDLLVHVLDASENVPILLLCTSRHDLLEKRPDWGERRSALRLVLRPLTDAAAAQVAVNLLGATGLPAEVVSRIVEAAEGNPLYVEQMLSMLVDSGALRQEEGRWVRAESYGEIAIPPTIKALIEGRLGQLRREERAAIEPASVIGMQFAASAVASLAPEPVRPTIDDHLAALTRKQLVHAVGFGGRGLAVPLPPPPGARHGVRRPPEARPGDVARRFRALGRSGQRGARSRARVRGDPRLPPRAGAQVPGGAGAAGRERPGDRRRCRASPVVGRTSGIRTRRREGGGQPVSARRRAAPARGSARACRCFPSSAKSSWSSVSLPNRGRSSTKRSPARRPSATKGWRRRRCWPACSFACTAASPAAGATRPWS